jgi:hypothetical protein
MAESNEFEPKNVIEWRGLGERTRRKKRKGEKRTTIMQ